MKQYILTSILVLVAMISHAQISINELNLSLYAELEIKSTNKGILIPRIALDSTNSPRPVTTVINNVPQSLLVFNTNPDSDLDHGYYYWDQNSWNKWLTKATLRTPWNKATTTEPAVFNTDNIYQMGNIGIGTIRPQAALDIAGTLQVEDTGAITSNTLLVIDESGKLGSAISIPSKFAFIKSKTPIELTTTQATSLNNAVDIVITWENEDLISNNVVDYEPSDHVFTIRESAAYEVSGFINYNANATIPATYTTNREQSLIALNVTVQYKKKGTTVWNLFASTRYSIQRAAVLNNFFTITIAPALMEFDAGDQIRMIIKRPNNTFGLPHGTSGPIRIDSALGENTFSRSLKIIQLWIVQNHGFI